MSVMEENKIEYLVVHGSATPAHMEVTAETINKWHLERGWDEIGYHLVIRRSGLVEIGRGFDTPGAHVKGYNSNSWGICMIGGIDEDGETEDNYTYEQFSSLFICLRFLRLMAPAAQILGHRDFPDTDTDCPSFNVRRMLPGDLR